MGMNGQAIMSDFYAAQVTVADRFQEPQSWELWKAGETETDLVDLGNIDRVPVSIIMPTADSLCPSEKAPEHLALVKSKDKHLIWQEGDHGAPASMISDTDMDRL